jgi:glutathione S-transferase
MALTLYVGTRHLSSWSLRAFLALHHVGVPFDEVVVELDRPDSHDRLRAVTPSGRVPAMVHDGLLVWDSLAICEYLAETFPEAQLWPRERDARAHARAVSAEMHSGFGAMRANLSMDLRTSRPGEGHTPEALADCARVMEIWRDCRARAGAGPYLFGAFSIADCMFAPVTTRFATYAVPMDDVAEAYVATIAASPGMRAWRDSI